MGSQPSQIIQITPDASLEALHVETFINTTTKATKVSDESVNRALIRGNVRTAKKALKDIVLALSHLFPDSATGTSLDDVADDHGVAGRLGAAQSSTYIRIVADSGTLYQAGINVVSDNKGNSFDLEENITIGTLGYDYVKVRSQQSGEKSNVDPYTLINISPEPSGHIGVINEYAAIGGRDAEDDNTFRQRIKEGPDILAKGTLSYLTQAFIKINPNVLRVIFEGINEVGKVVLSILTVNGIDLTDDELQTILEQSGQYFSLTELAPIGTQAYGVELKNATYTPIDVEFRISLFSGFDFDTIVKEIQQKFTKLVNFQNWDSSVDTIQKTDLIRIIKNVKGVKSLPDTYFTPINDISLLNNEFPRFRGFIVRDLNGNIISNNTSTLLPIFYPNAPDINFQQTVLS